MLSKRKQPATVRPHKEPAVLSRKPKKSKCRNGVDALALAARKPRASHIPPEIFSLLVQKLDKNLKSLLLLSMTCRTARDVILRDDELWFEILRRREVVAFGFHTYAIKGQPIVRNIPMTPYPNFKDVEGYAPAGWQLSFAPPDWLYHRLEWPHMEAPEKTEPFTPEELAAFANHSRQIARVTSFRHCGVCGSKRNPVCVWGLGCQVCPPCLKSNLVSCAALFEEYGMTYSRDSARMLGKVFCVPDHDRRTKVAYLTYNHIDYAEKTKGSLVYFWRPHLSEIYDLPALKLSHRARVSAANALQAKIRGLCIRIGILQKNLSAQCVKLFHSHSSHSVFLNAKAAPDKSGCYSTFPCTDSERTLVNTWLPTAPKFSRLMEPECRSYSILQRAFLAFRGRATLPAANFPERTLERLRSSEALRVEKVISNREDMNKLWSLALRPWFDMIPTMRGK